MYPGSVAEHFQMNGQRSDMTLVLEAKTQAGASGFASSVSLRREGGRSSLERGFQLQAGSQGPATSPATPLGLPHSLPLFVAALPHTFGKGWGRVASARLSQLWLL